MSSLSLNRVEYYLPERAVTIEDEMREHPTWNIEMAFKSTGVRRRFVAGPDETALDLGLAACRKLFQVEAQPAPVDAIICCTQSPDYVMPANAFLIHRALGLPESCITLDFNMACSGFIHGLGLAQGYLSAGLAKNVLLVTCDTYTKLIHPQDRSANLLFSDGAAATLFSNEPGALRLLDLTFGAAGSNYDKFIIPAGGMRKPRSPETERTTVDASGNVKSPCHINMDGMAILAFVNSKVPSHVRQILARNSLQAQDIALFVFHQASRVALDSLTRLLGLPKEKVYTNLEMVGNTAASSIPIALKEILESRKLKAGDKIVLCGFGVGLSWGAALMEAA